MISNLQGLDTFKSLLDKDEHFFAPSLCNLLCAIKKNKELWHATNEKALAEENEDSAPLNAKEAKFLKALNNDHEKVEQYCNEHTIVSNLATVIAVGGNIKNPDNVVDRLAKNAKKLFINHDNDSGGRAMLTKWQKLYVHASPCPVPVEKDISEAAAMGFDVQSWLMKMVCD